ncbi:MAG: CPBP family intramembrane metalloprotease [Solirubrobacteraceae bacterium]|nr:CPBP family intramembrane metalloprotease [Solirubrobacteraceae bacterium]
MTDDPFGPEAGDPRYLPELPVPGPPPVPGVVPPPVTPPPPGTPPPGTPVPGSLKPSGADGWRWYYALLAFFGGLVVSQIAVLIIGVIWVATSGKDLDVLQDDSSFIVVASAVNEILFIATAVFVARMSGSFAWRDFGLVRAPFKRTVILMAAVMATYFLILGIYNELVNLAPDDAPEKLGAGAGELRMLCFALLVAVLAPIAEEIFFRGMIFRALWNGIGLWPAAIVSGLLFGALHIDAGTAERLLQVVPLAILGVSFALLYSWTGTLYSTIALHATNNAIAVAAFAEEHNSDFGLVLAGVLWVLMMLGCGFGYLVTDRKTDVPPNEFPGGGDGPVEYALPR